MKAVILAAGEGRRCRPLTQTRSKVMLPVGNRPFLEHVIRALAVNGIEDLLVVVGYQKERIMNHFEDGLRYGVRMEYFHQHETLGTAHALKTVRSKIDDEFLVLNGDNLVDGRAIHDLLSADGDNVILAALGTHSGDYGVLSVEGDCVTRIVEKPGKPCAGILNTGAYRFSPNIFDELDKTPISDRGSYELTQTVGRLIDSGKDVRAKVTSGTWSDAIFAWDLLMANSLAFDLGEMRVDGEIEDGARIRGAVGVGKGSVIRSGTYIIGPVVIGRNCDIGPNATILPTTSISDSVRIGSSSEVRNSIVMSGSRIGSGTIVTDSVIGSSCALGDQVMLETGSSLVEVEDLILRAEFGAILADGVVASGRAFMHPGTMVGATSRIGPGAVIRGWIDRGSRVI
ncbi:MAG: NTP transferase domain-containing protein [Methanotrichaceae archaeon]|nr:NTP transferase domain-containing protein [Methanotrichaceae archaeon]